MAPARDAEFLREIWALYGVGCVIFAARFFTRWRTVGFRNFCGDDWVSLAVLVCYTMDAITVDRLYLLGTNVDYTPKEVADFTQADFDRVHAGTKYQWSAWWTYTALIWGLKACMLFFYKRLTFGLWQQKLVRWLSIIVATTYGIVVLVILFGCFPIHLNWQISPAPPFERCGVRLQNFLVVTIFNVLTDAAILAVPIPLLWKLRVPPKQKIAIGFLLSSGVFVISAAIIRCVLSLNAHPSGININRWGVRETIVGIAAVNVPILRPMFTKSFWTGDFNGVSELRHGSSRHKIPGDSSSGARGTLTQTTISDRKRDNMYELDDKGPRTPDYVEYPDDQKDRSSLELPIEDGRGSSQGSQDWIMGRDPGGPITVETSIQVHNESMYINNDDDVERNAPWRVHKGHREGMSTHIGTGQ